MSLATEMRRSRTTAGLTQRGLAEAVGADFTYLSKIENGHDVPSRALVERIDAETHANGRVIAAWQGERCPTCERRLPHGGGEGPGS